MRDRLIELIDNMVINCPQSCSNSNKKYYEEECNHCISNQVADHLLENGVVVPPCKVGDKVYFTYNNNVHHLTIEKIVIKESGMFLVDKKFNDWYSVDEIGKSLYLTREEAERALNKTSGAVSLIDGHIDEA